MARPDQQDKIYEKNGKMFPLRCRPSEHENWEKAFGKGKVAALARLFLNAEANARAQNKSLLTNDVLAFVNPEDLSFYATKTA